MSELDAIREALGHGADEEAWPPGLTMAQAVARLREERSRVVTYLRRETYPCCRQCNSQLADWIERGDHLAEAGT